MLATYSTYFVHDCRICMVIKATMIEWKLSNYRQRLALMAAQTINIQTVRRETQCKYLPWHLFVQTLEKQWNYENLNTSSFSEADADDAPLNLSLKSGSEPKNSVSSENVLDLIMDKGTGKSSDSASGINNLSSLQNLTAGIGLLAGDSKGS